MSMPLYMQQMIQGPYLYRARRPWFKARQTVTGPLRSQSWDGLRAQVGRVDTGTLDREEVGWEDQDLDRSAPNK